MGLFDRIGKGNQQNQMQQIRNDPIGMAKKAGYQIPDNLRNDPRGMFMHLMQTGQIQNPMMQRLMPMMQRMGLK